MIRELARGAAVATLLASAILFATQDLSAQYGGGGRANDDAKLAAMPAPKLADGHPDLSGRWGGGGGGANGAQRFDAKGNYHNLRNDRKGSPVNQERDSGLDQRFLDNLPPYKPEFWEKVDYLDVNGNVEDSNFHCFPAGVPRTSMLNVLSSSSADRAG